MPEWFEERDIPMKHIRKGIAKRGLNDKALIPLGLLRSADNMAV